MLGFAVWFVMVCMLGMGWLVGFLAGDIFGRYAVRKFYADVIEKFITGRPR